jgi:hypothetical protein
MQDTMEIIGIEVGDRIVIESEYATIKMRAFDMSLEAFERRVKLEKQSSQEFMAAKEEGVQGGIFDIDCTSYLDLTLEDEDIPPIYLDKEVRDKLRVTFCDAVRVRRTAVSTVEREFTDFIMIIAIAMLGVVLTIPNLPGIASVGIIIAIIVIAIVLISMKIRHQIS